MRLISATCFLLLVCFAASADAGVFNLFYESDATLMHRRDLRHDRYTQRHNRKVHKHQNHHAERMGMYNMTAPFQGVPVRSCTMYQQSPERYYPLPAGAIHQSTTIRRTVQFNTTAGNSCGCGTAGCQSSGNGSCSCK